ncbi:AraC-type DNA-binding protein [Xaviernesmea oryzae]|uniref:AraC-type DNA-binding protein n=2 Tax=Xaviernesmea oryzae TaxID=464029 RepID=A0A1X7G1P8_9HYPH|nr:AraC-type DNA-binding protein [Xaviernesmea oryzae]
MISLGDVELVSISGDKAEALTELSALCLNRADSVMLVLVERGQVSIAQSGRLSSLREGQYALLDCGAKIRFSANGDVGVLGVFLPAFQLRARLRNMARMTGHPFSCTELPWRIARGLLRMLVNEIKYVPPQLSYSYANQVVEVVTVAVEADSQSMFGSSGRNALFKRCSAYVKSHISDCALDPNKISEAMGISVRYLHKVFQESGESVCAYLRTTRLETARMELADPQKSSLQVREIAHRVGFRSEAHFAAAFRSRYGQSATEWRKSSQMNVESA